ncbi:MAG TPA: TonB-dependent receptor [Gemmatimonadales bacterium]
MHSRSYVPIHAVRTMLLAALLLAAPALLHAQGAGTVSGRVTQAADGAPLGGVSVTVRGTGIAAVTSNAGYYTLHRVPAGPQVIVFRWLGYRPTSVEVTVGSGATVTADAALESVPVQVGDIIVSGASRAPERVVEAPAAVATVSPQVLENTSVTGQAPLVFQSVPGVDVVQSGVNDFNVNTRGFNSSLNRRMLILQDGRDLAIAFLGSQEWAGLPVPLEDLSRVEVVRGPGSALYGANAFSGVVAMTTPAAREIPGTKLTLAGGELSTFRGDLRHAGVTSQGRFGYRVNFGYNSSDTWTRSRTAPGDLAEEYAPATSAPVAPANPEFSPLSGQSVDPLTREATGDRDLLRNIYGSARFDLYTQGTGIATLEAGAARSENEVLVTGIGRVQVLKALKPFVRLNYAHERFNLMAYWNNRTSLDLQRALASPFAPATCKVRDDDAGEPIACSAGQLDETSNIFHGEVQGNQSFGESGRVIVGASIRNVQVNTYGTLMDPSNDDRSDEIYSAFGQAEYRLIPQVRLVAAARFDDGTLFEPQFSPKAAVVFSPNESHAFRVTVNRAFQTPNYSEFFLRANAGAPANFSLLEAGLRASPLGPALAGVPVGQLFTNSAVVPVLALGNATLDVEKITGWEAGYKGNIGDRAYVTLDLYLNDITDFVTDLIPGINPAYTFWTSPEQVPEQYRAPLEQAVRQQLAGAGQTVAAAGLTRVNGNTAIVVSYGNAGEVRERGFELGVGYQFTDKIRGEVSYSGFDFEIKEGTQAAGDLLVPNTPGKKANIALSYFDEQGFDANVSLRLVDGYSWAAGTFVGYVPATELLNAGAGYRVNNYLRVHLTGTNLLDQERYQLYGGSVIGRRLLGGITANF